MSEFDHFFKSLIDSGWSGSISEAGLGVPIQSALLEYPGASRVLQIGLCPYSKNFQGDSIKSGAIRAASREGVKYRAEQQLAQIEALNENGHVFAVATSCVHANPGIPGESHGWVYLIKSYPGLDRVRKHLCMHFWISKGHGATGWHQQDRAAIIEQSMHAMVWFLKSALLGETWEAPTYPLQGPLYIDVVDGPGVSFATQLSLLTPSNPIVFDAKGMARPAEIIRKYGRIYRGSFNPPTKAHEYVGHGSIFEICGQNVWGKTASAADIEHRVAMLRLFGAPVMVSADPYFADFHGMLVRRELSRDPITYVVGSDVLNAIVDPKNIRGDNFLDPLFKPHAKFEVHLREGIAISSSPFFDEMDITILTDSTVAEYSSTKARNGDKTLLSDAVAKYVEQNGLYAKA
jgi:nicotinic acid mononucleotide adenylyltransferase